MVQQMLADSDLLFRQADCIYKCRLVTKPTIFLWFFQDSGLFQAGFYGRYRSYMIHLGTLVDQGFINVHLLIPLNLYVSSWIFKPLERCWSGFSVLLFYACIPVVKIIIEDPILQALRHRETRVVQPQSLQTGGKIILVSWYSNPCFRAGEKYRHVCVVLVI